jgi:hypothetical protein
VAHRKNAEQTDPTLLKAAERKKRWEKGSVVEPWRCVWVRQSGGTAYFFFLLPFPSVARREEAPESQGASWGAQWLLLPKPFDIVSSIHPIALLSILFLSSLRCFSNSLEKEKKSGLYEFLVWIWASSLRLVLALLLPIENPFPLPFNSLRPICSSRW